LHVKWDNVYSILNEKKDVFFSTNLGSSEQCYGTKLISKIEMNMCILAIPSPSYDCEVWTLKQMDLRELKTAEMKFKKRMGIYSLSDHIIMKIFYKNSSWT
jgi:hypothetical protein